MKPTKLAVQNGSVGSGMILTFWDDRQLVFQPEHDGTVYRYLTGKPDCSSGYKRLSRDGCLSTATQGYDVCVKYGEPG